MTLQGSATPGVYAIARSSRLFTLDLATVSNLPFHCLCISNALFSIVILISEQLVAKRRRESQILVGMLFYALS